MDRWTRWRRKARRVASGAWGAVRRWVDRQARGLERLPEEMDRRHFMIWPAIVAGTGAMVVLAVAGVLGLGDWDWSWPLRLMTLGMTLGIFLFGLLVYVHVRRNQFLRLADAPVSPNALRRMGVTFFDFAIVIVIALLLWILEAWRHVNVPGWSPQWDHVPDGVWIASMVIAGLLAAGIVVAWLRERGIRARESRTGVRLPVLPGQSWTWRRAAGTGEGLRRAAPVVVGVCLWPE